MKTLKTLDRLAGIASCIVMLPVAAFVSTTSFAVDVASVLDGRKESAWAAGLIHECSKALAFAMGNTVKHGLFGCVTTKESRVAALQQSARMVATIFETSVENVMAMPYYKLMLEEYSKDMTFAQYLKTFKVLQTRMYSEALLQGLAVSFGEAAASGQQVANA